MSQILDKIRDVDPNNSDEVKDVLNVFFQQLVQHAEVNCKQWLQTLENVINRFPKYCMSHRNTIETYLTHFLKSPSCHHVVAAAKCAHALQQVRPSQEKTATPKSCWRDQMNLLCKTAHKLIDALFPEAAPFYKSMADQNKKKSSESSVNLPLSKVLVRLATVFGKKNAVNKSTLLNTRLRNVFIFVQAMLVEIYPVAKPIQPQIVLDLIVSALTASSGNKKDLADIPMIKIQALRTLDALIACLGANLIPYSPLVFRVGMQTLRWSSKNPSDDASKVRCNAYASIVKWLNTLHAYKPPAASRGRSFEEEITAHIINDVTPPQRVMQLTMNAQPNKHLSKKARKKLANTMLKESAIAAHMPGEKNKITVSEESNDEVAIAALACTETFLIVCGIFLKPETHEHFQERLVRECYNLSAYSNERSLCLLRALEAARKSTPGNVPPPTQYCLQLYSTHVNDRDMAISKFCTQALLDIRLHLYCSPPSLNFALEIPLEKKRTKDGKKTMSERNREALESLLGAEKMASINIDEDSCDEPANKRQRLDEDITENISLSSESVHSINISDDSMQGNDEVQEKTDDKADADRSPEEDEDFIPLEVNLVIEEVTGNDDTTEEIIIDPVVIEENEENITTQYETSEPEQTENITQQTENSGQEENIITRQKTENVEQQENIETQQTIGNLEQEQNNTMQQKTDKNKTDIFEAKTQMPLNESNDTVEERNSPLSIEVVYDYPNTGNEKVTVLEKMDDENLPSSNETNDIQITCGQLAKSPLNSSEKNVIEELETAEPKLGEDVHIANGIDKSPKEVENTDFSNENITETVTVKITTNDNQNVTLDDMLTDFVDEDADNNAVES